MLTQESLKHLVESRLQAAGIGLNSGAPATLWVIVTLVSEGSSECFLYVDGRLVEKARLERR